MHEDRLVFRLGLQDRGIDDLLRRFRSLGRRQHSAAQKERRTQKNKLNCP